MRLTGLILIFAPCLLASCSLFGYTEEETNEKMRAFERGGLEETSAERDVRGSREVIAGYNRYHIR
jgi:hypothetical protein